MLEATPGKPWGIGFRDLLDVEPNMRWRYAETNAIHTEGKCWLNRVQEEDRQGAYGTQRISHDLDQFPTSWHSR